MGRGNYTYIGNCASLGMAAVEDLREMTDNAKEIDYKKALARLGKEELQNVFPDYNWSLSPQNGLRMQNDWAVRYHESKYKGKRCIYVWHSAYEYIWVMEPRLDDLRRKDERAKEELHALTLP